MERKFKKIPLSIGSGKDNSTFRSQANDVDKKKRGDKCEEIQLCK